MCAGSSCPIKRGSPKLRFCATTTVATLPSALSMSVYRSVQVGCSRFSRCCHLIIDLPFHLDDGSWARQLTQSPKPGA
jgi:hypothetical protein